MMKRLFAAKWINRIIVVIAGCLCLYGLILLTHCRTKDIEVSHSTVMSLAQLVELMKSKEEILLDRRLRERKVFISSGSYTVDELVRIICEVHELELRNVRGTKFLGLLPRVESAQVVPIPYYGISPQTQSELMSTPFFRQFLKRDLTSWGIPFSADFFAHRKKVPFTALSKEQKVFVIYLVRMTGMARQLATAIRMGDGRTAKLSGPLYAWEDDYSYAKLQEKVKKTSDDELEKEARITGVSELTLEFHLPLFEIFVVRLQSSEELPANVYKSEFVVMHCIPSWSY